jgi:hypothetical protein
MRVCVTTIGPRRDSRSKDRPCPDTRTRKDDPRQDARPCTARHPQKVRRLQDSDDRSFCAQSVALDFFSVPAIGLSTW